MKQPPQVIDVNSLRERVQMFSPRVPDRIYEKHSQLIELSVLAFITRHYLVTFINGQPRAACRHWITNPEHECELCIVQTKLKREVSKSDRVLVQTAVHDRFRRPDQPLNFGGIW